MQLLRDMINFIKTLSTVDVIFFVAVLALMILVITLIYFIRENTEQEVEENAISPNALPSEDNTKNEIISLKEISAAIENAEPSTINLNNYEEEQEEKAIISYEELLKHKNDFAINYSEEESFADDLTVKKIDLDNLVNRDIQVKPELNVTLISYDKEEAFLKALKALQQSLN
ncbi:MAG: hypothetical protein K2J20_03010 [Bacilli bacterium]|nr:hypothetical protein [Bacilli bacterium]